MTLKMGAHYRNYLLVRNTILNCLPHRINENVAHEFVKTLIELMFNDGIACYYILLKYQCPILKVKLPQNKKLSIHLIAFYVYNYLIKPYCI